MRADETVILTRGELEQLASMADVVQAVEGVLLAHGRGQVVMPAKITLDLGESRPWPDYGAFINAMPAYVGPLDVAGLKWAGGFWRNRSRGLSSVQASLILNDPQTGLVRAFMEAGWITAMRTGAVTAVGAKYLARSDAQQVAIIGTGEQGEYQLRALKCVLAIKRVKAFDVRAEAREAYARKMSAELDVEVVVASDVKEAVREADVVATVTTSREPLLDGNWLKAGCLVSALGSYEELCDNVVKVVDKIVVDNLEQIKHRGGLAPKFQRGVLEEAGIHAELGDVVAGNKAGRERGDERILLVPIGMGSEDIATAHMLFQRATQKNVGVRVNLLS